MVRALTLLLLLLAPLAQASEIPHLCRELANGDPGDARRCQAHVEFFEVAPEVVKACTKFGKTVDLRMRCLKSGADENTLSICKSAGWSLENTFTCLRSAPDYDVLRSCQKVGSSEEDQVQCIRRGRETVQIDACTQALPDASTRLHCLDEVFTKYEIRRCEVTNRSTRDRIDCLDDIIADRKGLPSSSNRALASEPSKKKK